MAVTKEAEIRAKGGTFCATNSFRHAESPEYFFKKLAEGFVFHIGQHACSNDKPGEFVPQNEWGMRGGGVIIPPRIEVNGP